MADIEAIITCTRHTPFFRGYRPVHAVTGDYLTTGVHHYYDVEYVHYGESAIGTITFISPEAYPNSLWVGKVLEIQEGSKLVGYAMVTKIFNEILKIKE